MFTLHGMSTSGVLVLVYMCLLTTVSVNGGQYGPRLCGKNLVEMMKRVCTKEGHDSPCFKGPSYSKRSLTPRNEYFEQLAPFDDDFGDLDANRVFRRILKREGTLTTQCCEIGCSVDYLKTFCC